MYYNDQKPKSSSKYQQVCIIILWSLLASEPDVARPRVRHHSGAVSDVSGGGVTNNGGSVSGVLIDSNNSSGANTGVVSCNISSGHV